MSPLTHEVLPLKNGILGKHGSGISKWHGNNGVGSAVLRQVIVTNLCPFGLVAKTITGLFFTISGSLKP